MAKSTKKTTSTKTADSKKDSRKPAAYPAVGSPAPDFTTAASSGQTVRLKDFRGKVVALYFYPKDDTSGCTKEACGFRDSHASLTKAGIVVLGVSPDSVASHDKFITKYQLPFTLLADTEKAICTAYGVWQEKSMYGRKYMGVARTTFVIDKEGRIARIFEKVKTDGHDAEVLDFVRQNLS